MKTLRGLYKVFFFLMMVSCYLVVTFVGQLFIRDLRKRRHFFTNVVSFVCRNALRLFSVRVIVRNLPAKDRNYLFICNHMGFLDILVLASAHPSLFITSVEMQQTPGLGLVCEMAGCFFVERRSRLGIQKEIEQIRLALVQGLCVTLYPEGTSTDGQKLLPFKKSLLTAAAGTGVPILPMVLNYTSVNGDPMSDKYRDHVCWYGDQGFIPMMWRMLTSSSIVAELEFLEEIQVHSEEDRREVTARAQAQIEAKFKPIVRPV